MQLEEVHQIEFVCCSLRNSLGRERFRESWVPSNFFSGQKCVEMALGVLATGNAENLYLLPYYLQGMLHAFLFPLCSKQRGGYCTSHSTDTKSEVLGVDMSNQSRRGENSGGRFTSMHNQCSTISFLHATRSEYLLCARHLSTPCTGDTCSR